MRNLKLPYNEIELITTGFPDKILLALAILVILCLIALVCLQNQYFVAEFSFKGFHYEPPGSHFHIQKTRLHFVAQYIYSIDRPASTRNEVF